jgi:hypothetical protein
VFFFGPSGADWAPALGQHNETGLGRSTTVLLYVARCRAPVEASGPAVALPLSRLRRYGCSGVVTVQAEPQGTYSLEPEGGRAALVTYFPLPARLVCFLTATSPTGTGVSYSSVHRPGTGIH